MKIPVFPHFSSFYWNSTDFFQFMTFCLGFNEQGLTRNKGKLKQLLMEGKFGPNYRKFTLESKFLDP